MKLAALLFSFAALAWSNEPQLSFTKNFPGSEPAFENVVIDRNGSLAYKEAPTDDNPVSAKLSEEETAALFDMADKLNHFKDPLDSGLKVANTGKKTFRYVNESGAATEAVFNYSQNAIAQELLDRFEQICASERAYADLDRTVHFDKLGVNDSLATIEQLWLRKQLAAPDQFMPLLNRIIAHESYMHLVRERAARLRDDFQGGTKPDTAEGPAKAQPSQ